MASSYTMFSGDNRTVNIGISDETGTPTDVSTATAITYVICKTSGDIVTEKSLLDGITVVTSVVSVDLLPVDTAALLGGSYTHELSIVTAAGKVFTALQGTVTIKRDYIE